MSIPVRRDDGIDEPLPYSPHGAGRSSLAAPDLSANVSPAVAGIADRPLALGIGGFNIEPPAPRASPVEGDAASEDTRELSPIAPPTAPEIGAVVPMSIPSAVPMVVSGEVINGEATNINLTPPRVRSVEGSIPFKSMQGRWLLDADPTPQRMWIGKLSFVFSLAAIVLGPASLLLLNEFRKDAGGIAAVMSPLVDTRPRLPVPPARLVVQSERGFANEPLPLGVSLVDASGEESLMLIGLVAGSRLSAGTALGSTGWQLSADSIGNAFVYAPRDFVGVMDAVIDLRSASNQPMDVQVVRFEWIRKEKEEKYSTPEPDRSKSPPVISPLNPEEIAFLIKRGDDFLSVGDIAAAQMLLKRAANAGSAQAALEVGMSFDPVFLAERGVLGFAADVAQAREWYNKARKLGSAEASRHIERLASTGG